MSRPSGPAHPWLIAVVATLAMSVSYLDRQTLAAIAPTVRTELALSHERYGFLTAAFAGAYLACAPLGGLLADRYGARRVLGFSVVLWSLVAAGHGLVTSFATLFAMRVALGVAESPSFPAATQTIHRALPAARRSLGMGLLFTGSSIGAMVAAPLAVAVTARHGFRFAFVATAAVGLLWLPVWLLATPDLKGPPPEREASRMPFLDLCAHPAMRRQVLLVATSAPAILLVMQWFPQYLVEVSAVPKEDVGHYLWLPPLVFDAAAIAFGAAASALDVRRPGSAHRSLVIVAAILTAFLALVPFAPGPWSRVLLASVSMGGGAGMYVLGTADLLRRLPAYAVASAMGLSASVQSLSQIIVSPMIGAALDRDAWNLVMASLGLVALPGALLWAMLKVPPLAPTLDDADPEPPAPPLT